MSDYAVTKTLDCKGLACPMPIVKLSMEIAKMKVGEVVEMLSTDPGSLADVPSWAKSTGNAVLETKQDSGLIRFYVKRQK
ncbi:MAG TPA: sulfurtransferase TusA family protein [Rectinemataceae bacterium]|jgi:TusA-related sulfurtransferase|nr:sulfurtransferase TusA family protein [Rectinemataceae bacterium]